MTRTRCANCDEVFKSKQAWEKHDCPNFDKEAFSNLPLHLMKQVAQGKLTSAEAIQKANA